MAHVTPFAATIPKADVAAEIASLPYDVYTRKEAKEEVKDKPLSFLRIDRAEVTLPDSVGTYDEEVYKKAKENFDYLKNGGYLIRGEKPVFFLYELEKDGQSQTGLVATCPVDDYLSGKIKEHEKTRREKEEDRIRHVDTLSAQTGPIFLTYRHSGSVSMYLETLKECEPLFSFTADDEVTHRVWEIDDSEEIERIEKLFTGIDSLYIADGHHRCASAVKVALNRREKGRPGDYNNFLSVIFPDNELQILDYNRVVKDLNGMSEEEFLEEVKKSFFVSEEEKPVKPQEKATFGMYLGDKWYKLTLKEELPEDPLKRLDVSLLYDNLLAPILGIGDPRVDRRIDFVGGIKGLKALEERVNTDMQVAFSLYPTKIEELFEISDKGLLMPPKSTWFEPKLRSGLFIHEF